MLNRLNKQHILLLGIALFAVGLLANQWLLTALLSSDGQTVFWLEVEAGKEQRFTVPRDVYSHNTVACGDTATGSVDIRTQTTLVFTQCDGKPPNPGERSIEKIHIDDSPDRGDFKFQFNGQINKR